MLIFGYDDVESNNSIYVNCFKSVDDGESLSLGWASFDMDVNTPDDEIGKGNKIRHMFHHHTLSNFFDIKIMDVKDIKEKYYYPIDVYNHDFWKEDEARFPVISKKALKDLRSGLCKILVLFVTESINKKEELRTIHVYNSWAANNQLPPNSIIFSSGNFNFGDLYERETCLKYIPYSCWEHTYFHTYSGEDNKELIFHLLSKKERDKVFLCYNRRAKNFRCKLVYELIKNGLIEYGYVSLGKNVNYDIYKESIPYDFYNKLPISFDDTDLNVNHANEFVKKDFMNSYVSVVSETSVDAGDIFPTEKTFKPIVGMQPFIIVSSYGYLKFLRSLGYKTFSDWFDESYDLEEDDTERVLMIVDVIKDLCSKSKKELSNMLFEMKDVLYHNLKIFLKRTSSKEYQYTLEEELWK